MRNLSAAVQDFACRPGAVGCIGIIRYVKQRFRGQKPTNSIGDREAADAGVEDSDGVRVVELLSTQVVGVSSCQVIGWSASSFDNPITRQFENVITVQVWPELQHLRQRFPRRRGVPAGQR